MKLETKNVKLETENVKLDTNEPKAVASTSSENVLNEWVFDTNESKAGASTSFDNGLSEWALATKQMCIICNERPKNGIFLHCTGGHMCCCYKCAVKYWNQSKRCAYCNRKVNNVVKAFIV